MSQEYCNYTTTSGEEYSVYHPETGDSGDLHQTLSGSVHFKTHRKQHRDLDENTESWMSRFFSNAEEECISEDFLEEDPDDIEVWLKFLDI
jgi:hypothetical protein